MRVDGPRIGGLTLTITSNKDAWAYASEHGFKYKRARIGYSIYRAFDGRTLEIGEFCAKLFRSSGTTPGFDKTKTDRLIAVYRYKTEDSK